MLFKRSYGYYLLFLILASQSSSYAQEATKSGTYQSEAFIKGKRHFIAINPIKPFIGLPNLHYEFQLKQQIGITAFSEVLAYIVIPDFNHPDAVNTIGLSFYPLMAEQRINQGAFVNVNTSYVTYFRDDKKRNSFANGVQVGFKWLLKRSYFLEPKLVFNYTYEDKRILPGFEVLLGINL